MISEHDLASVIVDLLDGLHGVDRESRVAAVARLLTDERKINEAGIAFARAGEASARAMRSLTPTGKKGS